MSFTQTLKYFIVEYIVLIVIGLIFFKKSIKNEKKENLNLRKRKESSNFLPHTDDKILKNVKNSDYKQSTN